MVPRTGGMTLEDHAPFPGAYLWAPSLEPKPPNAYAPSTFVVKMLKRSSYRTLMPRTLSSSLVLSATAYLFKPFLRLGLKNVQVNGLPFLLDALRERPEGRKGVVTGGSRGMWLGLIVSVQPQFSHG